VRLLIDSCVARCVALDLAADGHDVIHVADWPKDPGDDSVLETALRERRVVVTLDQDFATLAIVFRRPHAGIVRVMAEAPAAQSKLCRQAVARFGAQLEAGAIVTAEPGRLRLRIEE